MAAAKDLGLRGDEAAKVRKTIGTVAQRALGKLAEELEMYQPKPAKKVRGRRSSIEIDDVVKCAVPTDWVERFAKIADQLRRDYVIDESADETKDKTKPPRKALSGLKVVGRE